jgi:hypothetical protein
MMQFECDGQLLWHSADDDERCVARHQSDQVCGASDALRSAPSRSRCVCVCVCSWRRPRGVNQKLDAIALLKRRHDNGLSCLCLCLSHSVITLSLSLFVLHPPHTHTHTHTPSPPRCHTPPQCSTNKHFAFGLCFAFVCACLSIESAIRLERTHVLDYKDAAKWDWNALYDLVDGYLTLIF